jgi:hypothetical protein
MEDICVWIHSKNKNFAFYLGVLSAITLPYFPSAAAAFALLLIVLVIAGQALIWFN